MTCLQPKVWKSHVPWQWEIIVPPPVGALLAARGMRYMGGKAGTEDKSPRVVTLEGKTSCFYAPYGQVQSIGIYLLPEENFRYQQLTDQQWLGSTFLFGRLTQTFCILWQPITRCYGLNICVPPKSLCWNPNSWYDGIRRRGSGEAVNWWGWKLSRMGLVPV